MGVKLLAVPVVTAAMCIVPLVGCAPEPVAAKPEPPKVTVQRPESRTLEDYDEYNGWTDAPAIVEVRSRVRGHIHKVHFVDGQFVQKDDLLFELDPRPFQSELDRAKEQVTIAEAQRENAFREEERQNGLWAQKATTRAEVDKAIAARKTWDAQIVGAQEEVKRKELELEYSKVTAPISGKISRALLTEGNLVNAGGTDPVLTTIVAIDPIQVYFSVDERALLEYRKNHSPGEAASFEGHPLKESQVPFSFKLETDKGYDHQGVLDFAENRIDPTTGTIEVRGSAPNPEGSFLPGSRVRVRVPVRASYEATLIPETAIQSDQDKKYLLCLNKENVVVRRDVQLGRLLDDGMRVILPGRAKNEGVTPDEWVIVLGVQRARLNYPVQPMDANGEPIGSAPAPAAETASTGRAPVR
jgi:RND family efflux transporter MFP subunit